MIELYDHQRKIIEQDPKWCGLFLGTGGGKTRIALELAYRKTLVVTLKTLRDDETWPKNAEEFGIIVNMKVISKEEFRRDHKILGYYDTVIFDEGHWSCGVRPKPKTKKGQEIIDTSQLYAAAVWYLQKHRPERFYFLSATPASKPMNVWAIASMFGCKWDFSQFRDKYYFKRGTGWQALYLPRKVENLNEKLIEILKRFGHTGKLEDWFDVPPQIDKTVYFELTTEQKRAMREIADMEADPMVKRAKMRTIENGVLYTYATERITPREERLVSATEFFPSEKIDYIIERAQEFKKILIFATYTGQVEAIAKALKKEGHENVVTLTGKTKDRGDLIKNARAAEKCIVIAQSSISAGYELPDFPCVIFASLSNKYLDYEQGRGRVLRANALKKNLYIHLVVKGGADEQCYKTIKSGQDFQEKLYE